MRGRQIQFKFHNNSLIINYDLSAVAASDRRQGETTKYVMLVTVMGSRIAHFHYKYFPQEFNAFFSLCEPIFFSGYRKHWS